MAPAFQKWSQLLRFVPPEWSQLLNIIPGILGKALKDI
jgi:hypothetical protein